jgi:hypothetical protein
MTSATARGDKSTGYSESPGLGLVFFAALMLLVAGLFNVLNLVTQLFFIPAYPFWALTIIAFDVFALYGLCVYGGRATMSDA